MCLNPRELKPPPPGCFSPQGGEKSVCGFSPNPKNNNANFRQCLPGLVTNMKTLSGLSHWAHSNVLSFGWESCVVSATSGRQDNSGGQFTFAHLPRENTPEHLAFLVKKKPKKSLTQRLKATKKKEKSLQLEGSLVKAIMQWCCLIIYESWFQVDDKTRWFLVITRGHRRTEGTWGVVDNDGRIR